MTNDEANLIIDIRDYFWMLPITNIDVSDGTAYITINIKPKSRVECIEINQMISINE